MASPKLEITEVSEVKKSRGSSRLMGYINVTFNDALTLKDVRVFKKGNEIEIRCPVKRIKRTDSREQFIDTAEFKKNYILEDIEERIISEGMLALKINREAKL